jgi:hypothetical protein
MDTFLHAHIDYNLNSELNLDLDSSSSNYSLSSIEDFLHVIKSKDIEMPTLKKTREELEIDLMNKYNITEDHVLSENPVINKNLNKKVDIMSNDEYECFKKLCRRIKNRRSSQNSRKRKHEYESTNKNVVGLLNKKLEDYEKIIEKIVLESRKYIGQPVLYEYFVKEVNTIIKQNN